MPIYEYQCGKCGERFEKIQSLNATAPSCPSCQGETKKLVSAPALQFKGEGWYVTDYAGKSSSSSSDAGNCSPAQQASCKQPACSGSAD